MSYLYLHCYLPLALITRHGWAQIKISHASTSSKTLMVSAIICEDLSFCPRNLGLNFLSFSHNIGCCKHWFSTWGLDECMKNVIQGIYESEPCPTNRPECNHTPPSVSNAAEQLLGKWYPNLDERKCKNDGHVPEWMLQEGYSYLFLFGTRTQCCAAFDQVDC